MKRFNSRLSKAEERMIQLEGRSFEIIQTKNTKQLRVKKTS
jgi:hypothetical protein